MTRVRTSDADVQHGWLDEDGPTSLATFPVYRQMGLLQIADGSGEGPLVAMARLIQDDAEHGGSYIVRMGVMTITMTVELEEQQP